MPSTHYLCCAPDSLHAAFLDWLTESQADSQIYHLSHRLEAHWQEQQVSVKDLLGLMSNCCCLLPEGIPMQRLHGLPKGASYSSLARKILGEFLAPTDLETRFGPVNAACK